ncbi:hypothetical protein RCL_jg284.t1 [Rhizophagus clarus]|uniref:Uncharacterized protein n=1 Tax=Rhizophagus clarus TaxID=94130 RepID=A0A8H3M3G2_9GLOM|nr:hypothetical protein RCL_jg284.t1 [Rhizophagus clarus]
MSLATPIPFTITSQRHAFLSFLFFCFLFLIKISLLFLGFSALPVSQLRSFCLVNTKFFFVLSITLHFLLFFLLLFDLFISMFPYLGNKKVYNNINRICKL